MIDIAAAKKYFQASDPEIAALISEYLASKPTALQKAKPEFYARELFESIVSQQLSTKVAKVIWQRFSDLVKRPDDPNQVKKFSIEQLRSVGLSNQKASYILAIATGVTDGTVHLNHLDELDDESVIEELIQLKGIGRWTAEMFLLFTLTRPDVFAAGDLGLKTAINRLKGRELSLADILEISQKWSPHRSAVSLALWYSLDNKN